MIGLINRYTACRFIRVYKVLYLALFSTLISFFIRQKVIIEFGATRVSSYGLLAPFFVIIFSILLGLEPFELGLLPGMLLVGIAMYLIQKPQK